MDGYRHFYQKYLHLAPFESPFSYRKHSTIGVGGEAKIAFFPRTIDEAVALFSALDADGQQYVVLGCLSNVLPRDGLSDKIVVCTKQLTGVSFEKDSAFALAGTTTGGFLKACKEQGVCGAEFLVGIPCTIGGAVYMNAGAADVYMESIVKKVLVYADGKTIWRQKDDCGYAYKHSAFMDGKTVILGICLEVSSASREEIEERTAYFRDKRKSLPKGRSMGCVFKNPAGGFAGKLIEEAGLKGKRIGGAYVSDKHANFILADGINACDVKTLIEEIKRTVYVKTGVKLEEEIRYLD